MDDKSVLLSPLPIKTAQPDLVAILAASIFVLIPPTAVTLVVPLAISSMAGVISATNGISSPLVGCVINPLAVERITSNWAFVRDERRADKTSLSPNLISSSLTESFSFTTGMI